MIWALLLTLAVLSAIAVGAGDRLALALGGEEGRLAWRVIRRFLLSIALPLAVIVALPFALLFHLLEFDPRVGQALIAGLVIATGWLTSTIFAQVDRVSGKAEKTRDYHKAIYAEIGNALRALWDEGQSESHVAATIDRMRADPEFVPFIPREQHDRVYEAILDEIEVLPRQTIDAIVAYYSQMQALSHIVEDMRGETFRSGMAQDRRIAMYEDYSSMRRQAFILGQYALELMKEYAKGGPEAADRVIARTLSIRDAGRSGRSAGSE
ncbi:hypothetical protein [Litorisediminicola beolgyonensis]|uniref:5-bromo-4-chloroindolyl phosphate hydrolysis protein n=1 Tax=Litorisediminicola beolgyonensis TaxID=1173614 RepID=A0ABW3ZG37_9RHOB